MMKIAIITDGNNKIGMGHIYQSITLADTILKKTDNQAKIFFITKSGKRITDLISEEGHEVYYCPNDDSIFDILLKENPDRIIFDKLNVAPILARRIKDVIDVKLIIFTNLTKANQYADVTVRADMGSNFKNIYNKDIITGKVQFWGPKYWLLRPEFHEYKKKGNLPSSSVKNIMLIFGGADPANLSSAVLNALLKIESSFKIILVLGAAFAHHEELNNVLKRNYSSTSSVQIIENITNIAETMYNSDVVFASPGLSFFEALAVGTPVVGFHQNKIQQDVYNGFLTTVAKSELFKLASIINNKSFIYPDDPFITSMEIGEGTDEILNEILN